VRSLVFDPSFWPEVKPRGLSQKDAEWINLFTNVLIINRQVGWMRKIGSPEASNRSQLVEKAVRRWLGDQTQKELERQTEEYYLSLSQAECNEDRQWSKIAAHSTKRLWGK
jgi:hypothetical protein